jgi:hypothetical protein
MPRSFARVDRFLAAAAIALVAGCATPPPEPEPEPALIVLPEPVMPVPEAPAVAPPAPAVVIVPGPPVPAPVNEDEQQAITLLADLQRYSALPSDELRRELGLALQAVTRTRTDASRVRLAILFTLPGTGSPDDARALALLDQVVGKNASASPVKQLAAVLHGQISERLKSLRDEQKRTAAAQEKLDALRAFERSSIMERSRNGGGGAGGGGGGGGTGGGSR